MRKILPFTFILGLGCIVSAPGETFPIPSSWDFSGTGTWFGAWSGENFGDGCRITVTGPPFGVGQSANTVAQSKTPILTIQPYTSYRASAMIAVHGPAGGVFGIKGAYEVSAFVSSQPAFTNYSVSFTTGGLEDTQVGAPLFLKCQLGAGVIGGGELIATNFAVTATPLPNLTVRPLFPHAPQVTWPTNFAGYVLEAAQDWPPTAWDEITNHPMEQNGLFSITFTNWAETGFFRLRKTFP